MSPKFWKNLKIVLIFLVALSIIGLICSLIILDGWKQLYLSICFGLFAINFAFALFFVKINDNKRK